MEHRLLIALEVVEILEALPQAVRRKLRAHIGRLRFIPEQLSDYSERDRVGRSVEVSVFAGYCIHYWIDSADLHVKVMEITQADG